MVKKLLSLVAAALPGAALGQTDLPDLLTRLDVQLSQKRPDLAAGLRPPLTDEKMTELETGYDVRLPDAVRAIYRWRDGQDPKEFTTFVNNMQFQPLEDVLATKQELDGMIGYDFELANWWHPGWLPLFHNGGGDYIVVDTVGIHTGNAGQLLTVYHDDAYRFMIAEDLSTFLRAVHDYLESTPVDEMDEFHIVDDFLPASEQSFRASGPVEPLR